MPVVFSNWGKQLVMYILFTWGNLLIFDYLVINSMWTILLDWVWLLMCINITMCFIAFLILRRLKFLELFSLDKFKAQLLLRRKWKEKKKDSIWLFLQGQVSSVFALALLFCLSVDYPQWGNLQITSKFKILRCVLIRSKATRIWTLWLGDHKL